MAVYCHINTVPNGSTGGIMMGEYRRLLAAGEESYAFWGRGRAFLVVRIIRSYTGVVDCMVLRKL